MEANPKALKKRLKEAGLSDPLIDAVWPAWWSEEASASESAKAELRFTIARKLGLSPESLFHDDVQFIWKDEARFKHLTNETDDEKSILTAFGISICKILLRSSNADTEQERIDSLELRASILRSRPFIDLQALLATCWAIGIPVIHLRVFPLTAKRMHAMVARVADRFAVLLGRDANYPASIAFTLAHEIGHIMLGHISGSSAIVDLGEPLNRDDSDNEESEADRYALELLLGTAHPKIDTNYKKFNSAQLADAALKNARPLQVEPGTLALCLAHAKGIWPVANAALPYIYLEKKPVWQEVNAIAQLELTHEGIDDDSADYLAKIMGIGDV